MNIWFTRTPKVQDFPIWAYVDRGDDVVLIRTLEEYVHEGILITWTFAKIPVPPADHVETRFLQLCEDKDNMVWGNRDWFRAGYNYGQICKDISGSNTRTAISNSNSGWKS